jgi:hypothetical protein
MPIAIAFIQGLFKLVGLGGFLVGYFADIWWLMMLGGCLVVLDDVIEMGMGILNPFFPILFAIVLANLLTPWYVGVFWASAAFKVLGIPISLIKVFAPRRFAMQALQRAEITRTYRS